MATLSNGPSTEGSVVVTGTEMESPVADDLRLVDDRGHGDQGSVNGETPMDQQLNKPVKKLGLGFGNKNCGRPSQGLLVLIIGTLVVGVAVTTALLIQIYMGNYEVAQAGGVATDVPECSLIGANVLRQGGGAVDAAIAAKFCIGVFKAHNSGLGGGGFMLVYDHRKDDSMAKVIDFRETAPSSASPDTYRDDPKLAERGPLSVGVPGEIRGLEAAHKEYGKLPWKDLIQPSIDIARNGFNVTKQILASLTKISIDDIVGEKFDNFKKIFVRDGKFVKEGDVITRPALAATLTAIAEQGAGAFYGGDIAQSIVDTTEGKITLADLRDYQVVWREPVKSTYNDKVVLTMPAPGSGPALLLMLNIIEGFNWTSQHQNLSSTYREMIEAFRFAYAERTNLADPDFVNGIKDSSNSMISKEEAKRIRHLILSYNGTKPVEFYHPASKGMKKTGGTTHLSVVDSKELYVSLTSTINWRYGSLLMTDTGILLNNELADFDFMTNTSGMNQNNLIEPNKRPLSSMVPTILYTSKQPCSLRLSLGAANGTRIITGVAQAILNLLSFGMNLTEAIATPRIHDELFGKATEVEAGFPKDIIDHLRSMGYTIDEVEESINVVEGVMMSKDTTTANSDPRTGGPDSAVSVNER